MAPADRTISELVARLRVADNQDVHNLLKRLTTKVLNQDAIIGVHQIILSKLLDFDVTGPTHPQLTFLKRELPAWGLSLRKTMLPTQSNSSQPEAIKQGAITFHSFPTQPILSKEDVLQHIKRLQNDPEFLKQLVPIIGKPEKRKAREDKFHRKLKKAKLPATVNLSDSEPPSA